MTPVREAILNVDDTEANLYVRTRMLREGGYRIIEARTGQDALDLVRSERPDLVLLDINLPDIDGLDVCRRIKNDPATAGVMVLQMSSTHITMPDRVSALDAGADSFLIDPVEPDELLAVVRALLRLGAAERGLKASLAEKEMLLQELNHRVKNNLQLIASMLMLERTKVSDPTLRPRLEDLHARILLLAKLHDQLHRSSAAGRINARDYVDRLVGDLRELHVERMNSIRISADIEPLLLSTDTAANVGLLLNEMLTNCFKHAFPHGESGEITVSMLRMKDARLRLSVADNGRGIGGIPASGSGSTGFG